MRIFNFAAGPATLPLPVLEQVQAELPDWQCSGMSVMEVSHRSKAFIRVAEQAEKDLRELLAVPAGYKVLFLQGGATGQFAAIPLNLAGPEATVDYINTGSWSKKVIGSTHLASPPPVDWGTGKLGILVQSLVFTFPSNSESG